MATKKSEIFIKAYDPVTVLRPLLFLTQEEEKACEDYDSAEIQDKLNFWRRIYIKGLKP